MALVPAEVLTPDVVSNDQLDGLASFIHAEHRRSKDALGDAVDSYLAIGRALAEARQALVSNQSFGEWFQAQEFGFNQQWAHVLRSAAELEPAVRAAITSQLVNGSGPNIEKAVHQARALGTGKAKTSKSKRTALGDVARTAGQDFRKAIERVERICADDRFAANKEQVAAHLHGHLSYAVEVCQDLIEQLNEEKS